MSNHKKSHQEIKEDTVTKETNGGRNSNNNDMACHDDNDIDQQSLLHQLHVVTS